MENECNTTVILPESKLWLHLMKEPGLRVIWSGHVRWSYTVDRKFFASAPVLSGTNKNDSLFLGIFHSLNRISIQLFLILMIFFIHKQK